MSAKPLFACVTLLALAGGSRVLAQYPATGGLPDPVGGADPAAGPDDGLTALERMSPPGYGPATPPAAPGVGPTGLTVPYPHGGGDLPPGSVAGPWGAGGASGADCCGPIGGHGPIGSELYFGPGANLLVGGGLLNNNLQVGWQLLGGFRTLFFNAPGDRAWVLDLGGSYTYNDARIPSDV